MPAKQPVRLPVVLSRDEVGLVLSQLDGAMWIIGMLLYGAGRRVGFRLQSPSILRVLQVQARVLQAPDTRRPQSTNKLGRAWKLWVWLNDWTKNPTAAPRSLQIWLYGTVPSANQRAALGARCHWKTQRLASDWKANRRHIDGGGRHMKEILEAMRATNAVFDEEVIAKGNVGALEPVYTTDARILPPGAEMVNGRPAIQQFWAGAIKGLGLKHAVLVTLDAMPAGDGIVEIGRADLETASGPAKVKYVVFWKQEAGRWKWHVDIWNPNS